MGVVVLEFGQFMLPCPRLLSWDWQVACCFALVVPLFGSAWGLAVALMVIWKRGSALYTRVAWSILVGVSCGGVAALAFPFWVVAHMCP